MESHRVGRGGQGIVWRGKGMVRRVGSTYSYRCACVLFLPSPTKLPLSYLSSCRSTIPVPPTAEGSPWGSACRGDRGPHAAGGSHAGGAAAAAPGGHASGGAALPCPALPCPALPCPALPCSW